MSSDYSEINESSSESESELKLSKFIESLLYDELCDEARVLIESQISFRIISNTLMKWSTLSLSNTIGGLNFSTLPYLPSVLIKMKFSLNLATQYSATKVAGSFVRRLMTSSTPMNNPVPLTSPIIEYLSFIWCSLLSMYFPTTIACSMRFSFSITSRTELATASDTGLPPYYLIDQIDHLFTSRTILTVLKYSVPIFSKLLAI